MGVLATRSPPRSTRVARFEKKTLLEMSDLTEAELLEIAGVPEADVNGVFLTAFAIALTGFDKIHDMERFILFGTALPEDTTLEKKRQAQAARALFLRLPEATQVTYRDMIAQQAGGKRRTRRHRKARKARKTTRRHR